MEKYQEGVWYRDDASVFTLVRTGRLLRDFDGKLSIPEMINKFYFRVYPQGRVSTEAEAKQMAQKIVDLLNQK